MAADDATLWAGVSPQPLFTVAKVEVYPKSGAPPTLKRAREPPLVWAGWGPRQTSNKPQGEATAAGLGAAPRVQWQGHTQRVYLPVTCSQWRAMPLASPEPLP